MKKPYITIHNNFGVAYFEPVCHGLTYDLDFCARHQAVRIYMLIFICYSVDLVQDSDYYALSSVIIIKGQNCEYN